VEQVATPVKAELSKLRLQEQKGPAFSSPSSDISYGSTAVNVASSPSKGDFKRGMAIYRPGSKAFFAGDNGEEQAHTPPTPLINPGDKKKQRRIEDFNSTASSHSRKLLFATENCHSPCEQETDERKLVNRQKQIDYGKNTVGYARYLSTVSRSARKRGDPWTPEKSQVCSKRSWDGQVRKWRRALHKHDPEELASHQDNENVTSLDESGSEASDNS